MVYVDLNDLQNADFHPDFPPYSVQMGPTCRPTGLHNFCFSKALDPYYSYGCLYRPTVLLTINQAAQIYLKKPRILGVLKKPLKGEK